MKNFKAETEEIFNKTPETLMTDTQILPFKAVRKCYKSMMEPKLLHNFLKSQNMFKFKSYHVPQTEHGRCSWKYCWSEA